jgi:hypothetical protein
MRFLTIIVIEEQIAGYGEHRGVFWASPERWHKEPNLRSSLYAMWMVVLAALKKPPHGLTGIRSPASNNVAVALMLNSGKTNLICVSLLSS